MTQTMPPFDSGGPLDAILDREHSSGWRNLFTAPLQTIAKNLYQLRSTQSPAIATDAITVVCTSDTHNSQPEVPAGDLLIHAGDLTQSGTIQELQTCLNWLNTLPHLHKIAIAGNHDIGLDAAKSKVDEGRALNWGSVIYLQESSVSLHFHSNRVLNLYGSPWTPKHGNWAFQYPRGMDVWTRTIPLDVDILVTHGPPRFHLDVDDLGDDSLLKEVWRTKPALHVFGHIHEGYGKDCMVFDQLEASYERIGRGEGGILDLLSMACWLVLSQLLPSATGHTWLVNPSAVGGLRDTIRRPPIVVRI